MTLTLSKTTGNKIEEVAMRISSYCLVFLAASVLVGGCGMDETDYASMQQCAVACADGPTIDGIDVSYWQGTIDWDSVAATNMSFAFIRTGDGYFEDPQ